MGIMTVQISIPRDTALPADAVVNTFHFSTVGEATHDHAVDAHGALQNFYNGAGSTSGSKISAYLAGYLNAPNARLKAYNLADAEPRAPIFDEVFAIDNNASTNHLPGEVALCLSYRTDPVSGVPAARLRGRVFIGPFSQGAIGTGDSSDSRPLLALREAMRDAGVRLADGPFAVSSAGVTWAVFSQVPDPIARPVTNVFVDDAWDTQRRRGAKAVGRLIGAP